MDRSEEKRYFAHQAPAPRVDLVIQNRYLFFEFFVNFVYET